MTKRDEGFGHFPAATVVRIGGVLTSAVADTGTRITIIDPRLAAGMDLTPTTKTGRMSVAGTRMKGRIVKAEIEMAGGSCSARVDAFVPDPDEDFTRGVLLGMEFLQKAKLRVDGETGTVYCPAEIGSLNGTRKRRRVRG